MTPRRLLIPEDVRTLIQHMHPTLNNKVRAALEAMVVNPDVGKALRDKHLRLRSVGVGRLRIVYRVASGAVDLVAVGPRRTVYEETLRLLRRDERS